MDSLGTAAFVEGSASSSGDVDVPAVSLSADEKSKLGKEMNGYVMVLFVKWTSH